MVNMYKDETRPIHHALCNCKLSGWPGATAPRALTFGCTCLSPHLHHHRHVVVQVHRLASERCTGWPQKPPVRRLKDAPFLAENAHAPVEARPQVLQVGVVMVHS